MVMRIWRWNRQQKKKSKRRQITITLPPEIIEEIDRRRGPAPRSLFIEEILREHLQRFEIKLIKKPLFRLKG